MADTTSDRVPSSRDADAESRPALALAIGDRVRLSREQLGRLITVLGARGFDVVGPTLRGAAIVYDSIAGLDDLPAGWTDHQEAGVYCLVRREDAALFGYAVGPQSWKVFLHPPALTLWKARRNAQGFATEKPDDAGRPRALVGARACELAAIARQDKVLLGGPHVDPHYAARREGLFILAVHCARPGGTCFCESMGTGPRCTAGFDIALTEIPEEVSTRFVADVGTTRGASVLCDVGAVPASRDECDRADAVVSAAAAQMGRCLDTDGLRDRLYQRSEDGCWNEVARRCLACGNCTMVCPTCFCTAVEDVEDLTGTEAARVRRWDSCFTLEFSYVHGGSVRTSVGARYRQWITHKLATWHDQFGESGCVGCGRCITWCPAGIDITQEAQAVGRRAAEEERDGHRNP